MEKKYRINLEDEGQDLLYFITDDIGKILKAGPSHNNLYIGGYIPIEELKIGDFCLIHHPPTIEFGSLKYKIEEILVHRNYENTTNDNPAGTNS